MKAAMIVATARVADSGFGRSWTALGGFLDCAIPLALTAVIVIGTATVAFGLK